MMETRRTLFFVIAAVVCGGAATITSIRLQPKELGEYEKVGTPFYPDFQDPTAAKSLKVVIFNEELATIKPFTVEFKDGRWRIPSHHNYPADAKDRLAKTAASVIGITRDALQSRRESDHSKYGVVDPETEDATVLKGRGQRLTLTDGDGKALADYIIGKPVEGQTDQYYVRAPKEPETYRVRLKIDLSTKFGDWIEPDLLKLDRYSLRDLTVDKYSLQPRGDGLAIVGKEISELFRTTDNDPWKLKGLDEKTEEVNTDVVRDMENHLDNLKIDGVRPKPQGIRPDLSVDPKIARDPLVRIALQQDLQDRGFFVGPDEKDQETLHLYSTEGEMTAGTNEGVRYALHFGQIFTGTDFEVEVGFANKEGEAPKEAGEKKTGGDEAAKSDEKKSEDDANQDDAEKGEKKEDDKAAGKKRSRYLFVTTSFDESLVGPAPTKPTEPVKPEGLPEEKPAETDAKPEKPGETPASEEKQDEKKEEKPQEKADDSAKPEGEESTSNDSTGEEEEELGEVLLAEADTTKPEEPAPAKADESPKAEEDTKSDEKPAGETKPDSEPSGEGEEKKAEESKPDPKVEYDRALEQYKKDLEKYENDLSQYNSKIEKGKKKVDELNKRFGGWYYVISAESFENLRLSRKDLVKPKEEKDEGAGAAKSPADPFNLPGGLPGEGLEEK